MRLSLFGHIAWELCLDGALVRREGAKLVSEVGEGSTERSAAGQGSAAHGGDGFTTRQERGRRSRVASRIAWREC